MNIEHAAKLTVEHLNQKQISKYNVLPVVNHHYGTNYAIAMHVEPVELHIFTISAMQCLIMKWTSFNTST